MSAKKNFKAQNPAEAFITKPLEEEPASIPDPQQKAQEEPIKEETGFSSLQVTATQKPPKGYKLNPLYVETKSKRVQLLVQPSVVETVKAIAREKGQSMNEIFNEAITQYIEREGLR